MLACGIDFKCRHIRSDMTLFAGVRFAGHFDRKAVARVAGRAGAHAAVQVDAADPLVGPAVDDRKFQFAGCFGVAGFMAGQHQFGAVTVIAGLGPGGIVGRHQLNFLVFVRRLCQNCMLVL